MYWYLVKIVYRIICGEGHHTPQFDEQLRFLKAASAEDAISKAMELGKEEEDHFLDHRDQPVEWRFINVTELYCLNECMDGAEVCSATREVDDADAYTRLINDKAASLLSKTALAVSET